MFDEKRERTKLSHTPDHELQKMHFEEMLSFATSRGVCRRRGLSSYFDVSEIECSYGPGEDSGCELCDVCSDGGQRVDNYDSDDLDHLTAGELAAIDVSVGQHLLSSQRNLGNELLHFVRKYTSICIVCQVAKHITDTHQMHQ